ncbi:MAG: hypothetical protein HOO67_06865 [Candidatus Peribacteraceae bacterium]|nr:hypothetical protein [Candidatus Peribacteraceae bacterium]
MSNKEIVPDLPTPKSLKAALWARIDHESRQEYTQMIQDDLDTARAELMQSHLLGSKASEIQFLQVVIDKLDKAIVRQRNSFGKKLEQIELLYGRLCMRVLQEDTKFARDIKRATEEKIFKDPADSAKRASEKMDADTEKAKKSLEKWRKNQKKLDAKFAHLLAVKEGRAVKGVDITVDEFTEEEASEDSVELAAKAIQKRAQKGERAGSAVHEKEPANARVFTPLTNPQEAIDIIRDALLRLDLASVPVGDDDTKAAKKKK